jgi:hypothetical protein
MPTPTAVRGKTRPSVLPTAFGPDKLFQLFTGLPVPDPITFVIDPEYLDRPNMYPRQATLLKIIFLRDDLFTEYDHAVIDEWESAFRETGNNGIVPGVRDRIRWLRERGHRWFRETLLVMGRRAGKGHVSGLSMAYVLWNYMAKGDPQRYYGVDRDKKLVAMVFAGKRDQAKATVWQDAVNYITGSNCFAPYIRAPLQAEKLSIYAPNDFLRMKKRADQGMNPEEINMATFELVPKESTLMAGRGPTSFCQAWDEMAHVVASGANRSAEEVYAAAKPSLDQFGKDAFIIEPSSPWQMLGQFYVNYCNSLLMDEETGQPVYPEMLMIQLASWDIYKDWERAHEIEIFPPDFMGDLGEYEGRPRPRFQPLRGAIQAYDDQMAREEQANPDTFKVERRSHFAVALDAYLNEAKVKQIFVPWDGRNPHFGQPMLGMQAKGRLDIEYTAHGDPSKSNANFGLALAHAEMGPDDRLHVVFDKIHHFEPQNFQDHIVDYDLVEEWIWDNFMKPFMPSVMSFDQFNSAQVIQRLGKRSRHAGLPKVTQVHEKTATRQRNWQRAEIFKTAVNMGWVHAPYYEQAELELRFLQEKNGVVDHPDSGPVQTKDVADAMMECVMALIGDQIVSMRAELGAMRPQGTMQGGVEPFPSMSRNDNFGQGPMTQQQIFQQLGGAGRARGMRPDSFRSPARTRGRRG